MIVASCSRRQLWVTRIKKEEEETRGAGAECQGRSRASKSECSHVSAKLQPDGKTNDEHTMARGMSFLEEMSSWLHRCYSRCNVKTSGKRLSATESRSETIFLLRTVLFVSCPARRTYKSHFELIFSYWVILEGLRLTLKTVREIDGHTLVFLKARVVSEFFFCESGYSDRWMNFSFNKS